MPSLVPLIAWLKDPAHYTPMCELIPSQSHKRRTTTQFLLCQGIIRYRHHEEQGEWRKSLEKHGFLRSKICGKLTIIFRSALAVLFWFLLFTFCIVAFSCSAYPEFESYCSSKKWWVVNPSANFTYEYIWLHTPSQCKVQNRKLVSSIYLSNKAR